MPCVTKQELINAQLDVISIEAVVNGPASGPTSIITTRLGVAVKSVSRVISELASIVSGLILNKNLISDTTSILFKTNNISKAEIGLTGDNNLHIRSSVDGSSWNETIVIDGTTGFVGVGTASPTHRMTIIGDNGTDATIVATRYKANPAVLYRRANGTAAAPTAVQSGDILGTFLASGYNGTVFNNFPVVLFFNATETYAPGAQGASLDIATTANGTAARAVRLKIDHDGSTRPGADNTYSLGNAATRWASIWAANGIIQTSDARDKKVIARIDGKLAACAIDIIKPVLFKWKNGANYIVPSETETEFDENGDLKPKIEIKNSPGKRLHAGFLAQDVKKAMDDVKVDFGAWGLDDVSDPNSRQWLRPDQLVPILWAALRQTRQELAELKTLVDTKK